ncbi:MAG: Phosphoenolpyruvate-dependent phosphotransferase system [Pseudomonadales bacterium]|nr:Phosphoenolpyruvate-dependent phosphotransferase system [Pseudomonadales bacterium]
MGAEAAPRAMLKSLRRVAQEVFAASDLGEALAIIVRRVRETMRTEVCSVYIHDPVTDRYVFMATEGLNKELEGRFSLGLDEGLIGLVARREEPLNLDDAESHPSFVFIEGSGEEVFKSFLGVPIIHHRQVLGVLVVQQRERRRFDEEEEAFLVTLSAQLAGMIAHAGAARSFRRGTRDPAARATEFPGVAGSPGIAVGRVVVVSPPADLKAVPHRDCADPAAELQVFQQAIAAVRAEVLAIRAELSTRVRPEEIALFDAYVMLLDDHALGGEVSERIRAGQWAQGALSQVVLAHVRTFEAMEDPYLRDRATDLRDLGRRVLAHLQADSRGAIDYPERTVLVGEEIPAALLAEVPEARLAAIVSVSGSGNSHAAILARAMGVPSVMGAVDLPFAEIDGAEIVVDGHEGRVLIDPAPELRQQYHEAMEAERAQARELESTLDLPCQLADGMPVRLFVNTGLDSQLMRTLGRGAEGVGLYRTEIPFLMRESFPTEEEQRLIYRSQLEAFAPRPVTMRTLDIGGDKALPYFPIEEENPFLGWRGIRVTLDHPEIFLAQVRAMLKASAGLDNLRVMLPMISSTQELDDALALLARARTEIAEEGWTIATPQVGVMVEVPSAVYQAADLARRVDFLSVGSNDLTQYLLAVDRNNARVAALYHPFHPAVLQALVRVVEAGHEVGRPVGICGELAGDPGAALLLVAMGYDTLSMNATSLARVKATLRRFSLADAEELLATVLRLDDARRIRATVEERLRAGGVALRP